jgi:hypothetical protein
MSRSGNLRRTAREHQEGKAGVVVQRIGVPYDLIHAALG